MSAMRQYPNHETQIAHKNAERRATNALNDLAAEVAILARRLSAGREVDGDDTQVITDKVRYLTQQLSTLGTLRDVCAWYAADLAEANRIPGTPDAAPGS